MELVAINKKYISIRKNNSVYIVIPRQAIVSFSLKNKFVLFSLKDGTSFSCLVQETEKIGKLFNNIFLDEKNDLINVHNKACSEIIEAKKIIFLGREMLFLFFVALLASPLVHYIIGNITGNEKFNGHLSVFLVYLLISCIIWCLIESKFLGEGTKIKIKYFYLGGKWMHLALNDSVYYSVNKDFIKNIYCLKWGKCIQLKDNTCFPCSGDFVLKELSAFKIKKRNVILKIILHIAGVVFSLIWACCSLYLLKI